MFILFSFVKEIYQNVRKEGSVKNPLSGAFLEMDIWIPDFNLCLEIQVCVHSYHFFYIYLFSRYFRMTTTSKVLGTIKIHCNQFKTETISIYFILCILKVVDFFLNIKSNSLRATNITLIQIPCWWNGSHQRFVEGSKQFWFLVSIPPHINILFC